MILQMTVMLMMIMITMMKIKKENDRENADISDDI